MLSFSLRGFCCGCRGGGSGGGGGGSGSRRGSSSCSSCSGGCSGGGCSGCGCCGGGGWRWDLRDYNLEPFEFLCLTSSARNPVILRTRGFTGI